MITHRAAAGRLIRALLLPALLAFSLAACDTLEVGVERTATPRPAVTSAPSNTATRTASVAPSATATKAATAVPATAAPTAAIPTVAPSPAPSATPKPPALVDRVKIFLVALEDGGKAGKAIGCGDSIVAVERQVQPTSEPLKTAYQELLSIHDRVYGQSGLYNALYQCDLKVDSVTLVAGKATVRLSGKTALGGVCDNPRVGAQLTETALQFSTVKEVAVFVNGTPMEQWLSLK